MFKKHADLKVHDLLVKSKEDNHHLAALKVAFSVLRKYNMKLNQAKCEFGVGSGKLLGFIVAKRGIESNPKKI